MKKTIFGILVVLVLASLLVGSFGCSRESEVSALKPGATLYVATTTSLYNTGLWGYLEPKFEQEYNASLHVLSLGSGNALTAGKAGDVDVLTVHDKPNELKFISDNYGVERIPFAYNYFLIVGPEGDPAGIKDMTPEAAFKKLYDTGSGKFVSRGDNSGTHSKEKAIWTGAGYSDYNAVKSTGAAAGWYIEAGGDMESTLRKASELEAYTLTDMGTFVSYKADLSLAPIVDEGAILLNVYSVIVCTKSTKNNEAKLEMANNMVEFLTSPEIQDLIGKYGVKDYGLQLFTPCFGNEPTA
jgi:tungstate transport system substrate-binding protein